MSAPDPMPEPLRLKRLLTASVRRVAVSPAGNLVEGVAQRLGRTFPDARSVRWLCFHTGEALHTRDGRAERVASMPYGARLIVPLDDYNGRYLYFHGAYEPHVTALIAELLGPGDTALDVGANIGYFTALFACRVGPEGRVHAFEPNPTLAERLARMISLNRFEGRVCLHRIAASDRAGTSRFYLSDHLGTSGMGSLVRKTYLDERVGVEVVTDTLDFVLQAENGPQIALMKMDVEGAEIAALAGMEQILRTSPPRAILCEVTDNRHSLPTDGAAFVDGHALIAFLRERDYAAFQVVPSGLTPFRGEPVEHAEFCFLHRGSLRAFAHLRRD